MDEPATLVLPAGQAVQVPAPAALNVLAPQMVQTSEAPLPAPAYPALQLHVADPAMLVLELGHAEHAAAALAEYVLARQPLEKAGQGADGRGDEGRGRQGRAGQGSAARDRARRMGAWARGRKCWGGAHVPEQGAPAVLKDPAAQAVFEKKKSAVGARPNP